MIYLHLISSADDDAVNQFKEDYAGRIKFDEMSDNIARYIAGHHDYYTSIRSLHLGLPDLEAGTIETAKVYEENGGFDVARAWGLIDYYRLAYPARATGIAGWQISNCVLPLLVNKSIEQNVPIPSWACADPRKRFNTPEMFNVDNIYRQGVYLKDRMLPDLFEVLALWTAKQSLELDITNEKELLHAVCNEKTRQKAEKAIHYMFTVWNFINTNLYGVRTDA